MGTIRIDFGSRGGSRAVKSLKSFNDELLRSINLSKNTGNTDPFKGVEESAKRAKTQIKGTSTETQKFGRNLNSILAGLSAGASFAVIDKLAGAFRQGFEAINGIIAASITEFASFEARLTEFEAKSGASAGAIESLGEEAKRLAAITSQTPATVAALGTQLLTLGVQAEDVEASLGGITKLADVLGEDPVFTGQIVQAGVANFRRFGETTDTVADQISNLQNSSAAGATGLGEFQFLLQQSGAVAANADISFGELGASFAVLREAGIRARPAATALRNVILSLAAPTDAAALELQAIGVNAFDAEGNFRGLGTVIEDFAAVAVNLSQEERLRIATAIFGREGAPAILASIDNIGGTYERVLNDVNNSTGEVDRTLEVVNQSLERQAQILQGKVSAAFTELGQIIAPVARVTVGFLDDAADASIALLQGFQALPGPIQAALLGTAGFTAALGAAIAALTIYNTVNGTRIAQELAALAALIKGNIALSVKTIQTAAATVAQTALAVATGQATAAQLAQTKAIAAGAAKLGLFVGAAASIALVADTFAKVTGPADALDDSLADINESLIEIKKSTDEIPDEVFGDEAQANVEALKKELGGVQGFLDGIRGAIPGLATAVEASTNRQKVAFGELSLGIGEIEGEANQLAASLQNGINVPAEELNATTAAIDKSIAALQAAQPVTETDIKQRDAQISRLERYRELLADTSALQDDVADGGDGQTPIEAQAAREAEIQEQTQDELFQRQQAFDREKFDRDKAREEEIAALREERQAGIDADRRGIEEELNQLKLEGEQALEDRKRAFESSQQAIEREFDQRQQEEERRFQEFQQGEERRFQQSQQEEERRFQEDLARQEQGIDREVQLRTADTPLERRDLERRFAEEDEKAALRAALEREAGIEQQKADFEERQRQDQLNFEEVISAQKREFESQLEQEKLTFEQGIENRKLAFERDVLQPEKLQLEDDLAAKRIELLAPVLEAEKALEDEIALLKFNQQQEEQRIARDFQAEQKQFEENYKAEIRNADIAASEQMADNIRQGAADAKETLESTRPPISGAQSGGAPTTSLRSGGTLQPYQPAKVHRDEYVVAGQQGATVISQARSRAIDAAALRQAGNTAAVNAKIMAAVEKQVKGLRADIAKRQAPRFDQTVYNYGQPQTEIAPAPSIWDVRF